MRRGAWVAVVGLALGVALAMPELAAAAVVEFKDTAGNALANETITIEEADPVLGVGQGFTVKTDASGKAEVPAGVSTGLYWVSAPGSMGAWVTFPTQRVVLPPAPWRVQNPKRLGDIALALGFSGSWVHELEFTLDFLEQIATDAAGNVVQSGTRTNDPAASTARFDVDFDRKGVLADIPFQVGPFDVGRGSLHIAPALIGGWQDWTLNIKDRQAGTTTEFTGNGGIIGGGLEVLYSPKNARWFGTLNAHYLTNLGDKAERSALPPTPGGTVTDSAELCYDEWGVGGRAGYRIPIDSPVFHTFAPWGGVLYQETKIGLHGHVLRTAADGATATANFKNEFKSSGPRGWVGLDFRLLRDYPVYGRVAATFDDKNYDLLGKFSYEWGVVAVK